MNTSHNADASEGRRRNRATALAAILAVTACRAPAPVAERASPRAAPSPPSDTPATAPANPAGRDAAVADARVLLTWELAEATRARATPYVPTLDALAATAGPRCAQLFAPGMSADARPPRLPVPPWLRDDPAVHQLAVGCIADARLPDEQREFALLRPDRDAYFFLEGELVDLPPRREDDRVAIMPNGMLNVVIRRRVPGHYDVEVRLILSR